METKFIPVVGGTYRYFDRGVSGQLTQNIYVEEIEGEGGKVGRILRPVPGYRMVLQPTVNGYNKVRALFFSSTGPDGVGRIWMIAGKNVLRVNSDMSYVVVGEVYDSSNNCKIIDNGVDAFIVDSQQAYKASLTASDAEILMSLSLVTLPIDDTTGNQIKPSNCVSIKQRFVIDSGSGYFWYSNAKSTVFEQLNFYEAESKGDPVNGLGIVQNRIYVLGPRTFEVWSSDGTNDDPFSPIQGTASQIGCMAPQSIAVLSDRIFWIGASDAGRYTVFVGTGLGDPKRISDNAIEEWIRSLSQPEAAEGWCYMERGHLFYVLNFSSDNITLVYDSSTDSWHTRLNQDTNTGRDIVYQPNCAATAFNGKLFVGGSRRGVLYEMSEDYHDFDGSPRIWKWVTPVFWADLDPMICREFVCDMTLGSTDVTDPESVDYSPSVMARFSRDGGFSFGTEVWRTIGRLGERMVNPPKWLNPSGLGRSMVAMLSGSFSVPFSIRGIRIKISRSLSR